MLAAGHINSEIEDEEVMDENCQVTEVRRKIWLYFNASIYDIGKAGKRILFIDRGKSATQWATRYSDANFEWRGKIKDSASEEYIKAQGREIAKEMDKMGYKFLTNNCRTFANKLWEAIKA
ncbi:hypothetical protein N7495_004185 [Penicillium taxi]|uniref:uncharacterized protein n=1 Tax=Penicillium taxi TaxID=168475 RepID=UPI002544DD33|nr:uncharacterized protein N7495_004185 [Penicillium taxi]KAJ5899441.1 hypothetical protein N7495_004185 [Penicillium taxi]